MPLELYLDTPLEKFSDGVSRSKPSAKGIPRFDASEVWARDAACGTIPNDFVGYPAAGLSFFAKLSSAESQQA